MAIVYVSKDSGARSLGADAVADALQAAAARRGAELRIIRTGSRGAYFLEPLVEVAVGTERIAYGPVTVDAVERLFDCGLLEGGAHETRLGQIDQHPWFAHQMRESFARVGIIDPLSISDFLEHHGFQGLRRALGMTPDEIVTEVTRSQLRGRGGAAFPTGVKWRTALDQSARQKYIVCNADEGDSGTFADRMIMEGDPLILIEGMTIAGLAVGADAGYIYLRAEYPDAYCTLQDAIELASRSGYLGRNILGSGRNFDIEVRLGAGAYICGEETSMLESLEGKRGEVRVRPPLPAIQGLFGAPTVINNVMTFASVPTILERGHEHYAHLGRGESRGTIAIQLGGNVKRGGLLELPFGCTLRELIFEYGGGTASGRPVRAAQVGGPLGAYIPESQFDVLIDYEELTNIGALLGHGGIVVFDDTVDMARMARHAMEFCALESCGKCTPCRIGSTRGAELLAELGSGRPPSAAPGPGLDLGALGTGSGRSGALALLEDLCETMLHGSLCGLGSMTPIPVRSAMRHFPEDFGLPKES